MTNTVRGPYVTADRVTSHFIGTIAQDFFALMTGEWLGGGIGRGVYVLGTDPSLVVKIETASHSFQNVAEWEVWDAVSEAKPSVSKWFAPCHYISPCGIVLIQARTKPADKSLFPKRMPAYFTDLKYQNFGMLDGQLVAHDYGYNRFIHLGLTASLREVTWRDDAEES